MKGLHSYCSPTGAIQANISCLSAIGELISETVLLAIYGATVEYYPGTVFFIGGFWIFICALLFV